MSIQDGHFPTIMILNRGFLKRWYPTTIGFPTKNDHFEVWNGGKPTILGNTQILHHLGILQVNAIRSGSEIEGWTPEEESGKPTSCGFRRGELPAGFVVCWTGLGWGWCCSLRFFGKKTTLWLVRRRFRRVKIQWLSMFFWESQLDLLQTFEHMGYA